MPDGSRPASRYSLLTGRFAAVSCLVLRCLASALPSSKIRIKSWWLNHLFSYGRAQLVAPLLSVAALQLHRRSHGPGHVQSYISFDVSIEFRHENRSLCRRVAL